MNFTYSDLEWRRVEACFRGSAAHPEEFAQLLASLRKGCEMFASLYHHDYEVRITNEKAIQKREKVKKVTLDYLQVLDENKSVLPRDMRQWLESMASDEGPILARYDLLNPPSAKTKENYVRRAYFEALIWAWLDSEQIKTMSSKDTSTNLLNILWACSLPVLLPGDKFGDDEDKKAKKTEQSGRDAMNVLIGDIKKHGFKYLKLRSDPAKVA